MSSSRTASVVSLYRYPVKGLSAQELEAVSLTAGRAIPFDRAYAIENGPSRFNPDDPKHQPTISFLTLMRNARLAGLQTTFDEETLTLTICRDGKQVARGVLGEKLGRQLIEQFLASYMQGDLRGRPRIVSAPGHNFADTPGNCLHLVNLASLRDLEKTVGRELDPLRFRGNLYIDNATPWEEKTWLDRTLTAGSVRLKVLEGTVRCRATNVDPKNGERNASIPPTLEQVFGDKCFGVYAEVIEGGEIRAGDAITLEG